MVAGMKLFPEVASYEKGMLPLDSTHTMYWEQSGNPRGRSVVFLHGGPGAGCVPNHRRFFDPAHYRIVLFDQRGAGKSTPYAAIENNTTPHLVSDIEKLREHLNIDEWLVFGGSWGSTLALAYAEAHPRRCSGLILRGVFLCRRSEIEWFLYHVRNIFPEPWREFSGFIPEPDRGDLLKAYYKRLTNPDPDVYMPAARAWGRYEGSCSTLLPSPATVAYFSKDNVSLALARLEAHYFTHDIFLPENSLLDNAHKLAGIPTVIVQGRYDAVCPTVSADDLMQQIPQAEYCIVPDAGHSAWEPGITSRLVEATENFKKRRQ